MDYDKVAAVVLVALIMVFVVLTIIMVLVARAVDILRVMHRDATRGDK